MWVRVPFGAFNHFFSEDYVEGKKDAQILSFTEVCYDLAGSKNTYIEACSDDISSDRD